MASTRPSAACAPTSRSKGIKFFMVVDQAQLGADAGLKLNPSKLLVFGNPPLGIQFLTANPDAGLDWPVRLLVNQDDAGQVWAVYTDFGWIARRHNITDRNAQFQMASEVIAFDHLERSGASSPDLNLGAYGGCHGSTKRSNGAKSPYAHRRRTDASSWCCRAAARSAPIKPASIRRCTRRVSSPIG